MVAEISSLAGAGIYNLDYHPSRCGLVDLVTGSAVAPAYRSDYYHRFDIARLVYVDLICPTWQLFVLLQFSAANKGSV